MFVRFAVSFCLLMLLEVASAKEMTSEPPIPNIGTSREGIQSSPNYPKVNPITGEYLEQAEDLVVACCEPLSARRFYNHMAYPSVLYASWRINPESWIKANFENTHLPLNVLIGRRDGSAYLLDVKEDNQFKYSSDTQISPPLFSGQLDPGNISLTFRKTQFDEKVKAERFIYYGEIRDGAGARLRYTTHWHQWNDPLKHKGKKLYPDQWTPYYCRVQEEYLPNGNILKYEYERYQSDKVYPSHDRIQTITAHDSLGNEIGSLHFSYPEKKREKYHTQEIIISDGHGRSTRLPVHYKMIAHAEMRTSLGSIIAINEGTLQIDRAETPNAHPISYAYDENLRLTRVARPNGRVFVTEYEENGKVASQHAPVGRDTQLYPIATFNYLDEATEVIDAENNLTIYRYDARKLMTEIEHYFPNRSLYSIEKRVWSDDARIECIEFYNSKHECQRRLSFAYDDFGNVLIESSGDRAINRTYWDGEWASFNIKKTESDRPGKERRYFYKPGTNLLTKELLYEGNTVCQRTFHTYNAAAVCIRTVVDDGHSSDPDDLTDVTYRRITECTPRTESPCYGLPEIVEEKTIDSSGNEILLKRVVYSYTPAGQVATEDHYDSEGQWCYQLINTYDDFERLKSSTDPLGHKRTYTYDANNNLCQENGPRSDTFKSWTYDCANRVISEENSGLVTINRYDKKGNLIEQIDPCSNRTHYKYDALDRIIQVINPDGGVVIYDYDIFGNKTLEVDPNGFETRWSYNSHGQPVEILYPDNTTETFSYNPTGTLREKSDRSNLSIRYTYDLFDHPIREEHYSQSGVLLRFSEATYSPFRKLSERDFEGIETLYTYDFAGRLIEQRRGEQQLCYAYDSLGRLTTTQNGEILTIQVYDLLERVTETRQEDVNGNIYFRENYLYDELGNRTHTITCQGTTETIYTPYGKPEIIIDPEKATTHFIYSFEGNYTETRIDPLGTIHSQIYDNCGRLHQQQVKDTEKTLLQHQEFFYDPAGNCIKTLNHAYQDGEYLSTTTIYSNFGPGGRLEKLIEEEDKTTEYIYDSYGRLETLVKPDGTHLEHRYDSLGRLHELSSSREDIHHVYTYDHNNYPTLIEDRVAKGRTQRQYNAFGQITYERLGNGYELTHRYNQRNERIQTIYPDESSAHFTYAGGYLRTISYDPFSYPSDSHALTYSERNLAGQPTLITYPFGKSSIDYDASHRVSLITAPGYRASDYSYNPNGALISYHFEDSLGENDPSYTYDSLNQLIRENHHTYAHDSLYNRRQKDEMAYEVNELSQLLHDGETDYTYDRNGNLISAGSTTFTYDSLDRLIEVQTNEGTFIYTYDPFNRRLSKQVPHGKIINYIWDDKNEIGSSEGELRIIGQGFGAETGATALIRLQNQLCYPLHDHRGSIVSLLNTSGQNTAAYRYDAFGNSLTQSSPSPWGFAGKRLDPETGYLYFGVRYYSPQIGRWITPDPLGYADGPNLYAYTYNNPLIFCDLYGMFSMDQFWYSAWDWFGGIGGGLKFFGIGAPQEFYNFEDSFSNKSYNLDLGLLDFPAGQVGLTPGMSTKEATYLENLRVVSEMAGGYNLYGTYNATHGLYDFHEVAMNVFSGICTTPVQLIHQRWDTYFNSDLSGAPYLELCHSQGTAHVANALETYNEERRQRIQVAAFSPSKPISPEHCMRVRHFISENDFLHRFDIWGEEKYRGTLTVLPKHPDAGPGFDHSFRSPTLNASIKTVIEDYRNILSNFWAP